MLALPGLADFRMQQQIAHEIYRQQIMQRLPDPFATLFPFPAAFMSAVRPQQPELPDVTAKLENNELWQQFHQIGTEMIITKSGRRMFPSMRVSFTGLKAETNYCILLEMLPIGDCRYKFSGTQWLPAGGVEPQSPQRMYLHPDSPATGAHWQSQALLFNKVKLTNNTLDNNGLIVLASMHKYQPRIHVVRTSDLTQLPWAPQQNFVFPETEFIAVTAYQNDRITKLKIDNNPFAKGFRESGQSRCKRKLSASPDMEQKHARLANDDDDAEAEADANADDVHGSPDGSGGAIEATAHTKCLSKNIGSDLPVAENAVLSKYYDHTMEANFCYFYQEQQQRQQQMQIDYATYSTIATTTGCPNWPQSISTGSITCSLDDCESQASEADDCDFVDVVSTSNSSCNGGSNTPVAVAAPKRSSFSILDILGKTVTAA